MAKLKIVKGVDNPILRKVSDPVKKFDGRLKRLVRDMKKAMLDANGVGIAAPQVGISERIFLATMDVGTEGERFLAFVNPVIIWHGDEMEEDEEGCLSIPGVFGRVKRWREVAVEFFNEDGMRQRLELEGMNARVVQHEYDHIEGVLFVDRVSG
ncbi:peptide deformylase [Candidatus Peregrinibacteria bacterium HGW-Peregrinibacteria-1]|jgi:peptide deformylase|nr:MAG: peptide deformylase [Candidatus Peregrinibacteria bacterium HGW-Peregrinibacteria-1]